jgi:transposase
MSTSLLYHTCGIRGYEYRSTEYICGTTIVHIELPREKLRCPHCGRAEVSARGSKSRIFRSVPIGSKPVAIMLEVARVYCPKCNATRQVRVGFADEYRRHTRAFARYALELTRMGTIQDVADHLHVGWDLIKELKKSDLARRYRKVKLRGLKHLAIDEICIGRGRRYRTLVLDLDTGAIVFVGQGKGADALKPFWKRLQASRAKIQAVAADLSRAYTKAVRENLPKAALVYDRFHVVKLFNEKLSDLRRELYREATDQLEKQVLKGTRWLLLMNPENLDDAKGERRRLEEALRLNESLAKAYYLKEDLRQFWEQSDRAAAERFLTHWIRKAEASGIRMLKDFASTLAIHRRGLLAWYHYPISTGPLEGTNNKIRALTRQAYGFRDTEYFILQLYALHETRFLLVG